jgi:CRISPR-associated protein (TIGR03986 family)
MSLPRHKNPIDNNGDLIPTRTASAPYNFVPLPEVVVKAVTEAERLPDHNTYANADYPNTGYFDVTLTTKSPLYVRCPFTIDEFQRQESEQTREAEARLPYSQQVKNTPHFFYTRNQNQPVIPGSSLRGMLRSLLEIVSYGKVRWVDDKQTFFRAVGDTTSLGDLYRQRMQKQVNGGYCPRVEAGYLTRRNGVHYLTAAEHLSGAQYFRVEESDAIGVVPGLANMRTLVASGSRNRYEASAAYSWMRIPVWFQSVSPTTHSHTRAMYYSKITTFQSSQPASTAAWCEGVLIASGWIPAGYPRLGKHLHWIIGPMSTAAPIEVPEEDIIAYEEGGGLTDKIKKENLSPLPVGEGDNHAVACFFSQWQDSLGRDHITVGHTPFFRLPYEKTPLDLVPAALRRPEEIDDADAMLGFVRTRRELDEMKARGLPESPQGSKARAYASRLFVTDAALNQGQTDIWFSGDAVMTPRILATPKPTTFQHYLVQKEPNPVQVGQRRDGTPRYELRLRHYGSPTPEQTVIRGHKRYWHQGPAEGSSLTLGQIRQRIEEDRDRLREMAQQEATGKPDTQHTRFKPVKPEVSFAFRVYFENLSGRELGALCWTLHPLGDTEKHYCHHLGMGKPLGMGAVQLDATLHLTNRQGRYTSLFTDDYWQTGATGAGESLSDRATLEQRTNEFEQNILRELQPDMQCQHLSGLKRIGMLLKTMEWPGYCPEAARPGQPSPNNCVITDNANGRRRPNTRYMTIELPGVQGAQKNEYRERPVLPDPEAFGSLTGQAEPTVHIPHDSTPQARGGRGSAPTSQPPQTARHNPAYAATGEVESVKRALSSLRGPGEVSLLDGIVSRIEHLPNAADQRECAQLLHTWLKAHKLWGKEKHSQKNWHKKLETLLESPSRP